MYRKISPCEGIREIFACEIRNPGPWNLEYSCRNPESGIQDPVNKDGESSNWNPESTARNPKSKTGLGFTYMGREKSTKQKVNCLYSVFICVSK